MATTSISRRNNDFLTFYVNKISDSVYIDAIILYTYISLSQNDYVMSKSASFLLIVLNQRVHRGYILTYIHPEIIKYCDMNLIRYFTEDHIVYKNDYNYLRDKLFSEVDFDLYIDCVRQASIFITILESDLELQEI